MSDDKFDQDLRAVLSEDAPSEVPDALRRRVAAVPGMAPAAAPEPRASWWRRSPQWVGALVVLAVVVIGFWRFAPAPHIVGASPSVPPSVSPSVSAGPPVGCSALDLSARILAWQGAAGSRIADVDLTNNGDAACQVAGSPGLQLLDADGRVLIDSADSGEPPSGDPDVPLEPGERLRTEVAASNYCGPDPVLPIGIAFVLPAGAGQVVAAPVSGVSSDLAVPPCMGSAGGDISMNGWVR
jgi:hypothetical protein